MIYVNSDNLLNVKNMCFINLGFYKLYYFLVFFRFKLNIIRVLLSKVFFCGRK